jgi:hypothetical protein
LRGSDYVVGENPVEDLTSLDFSIEIRSGEKFYADFAASHPDAQDPARTLTNDFAGFLEYHSPILSSLDGLPSREIEQAKSGSITGYVIF